MKNSDRLSLAIETGQLDLPAGDTVVLRATPKVIYSDIANASFFQTFKPTVDALLQMGLTVSTDLPRNAKVVIVELTRSKQENLGLVAKGYNLLSADGVLVIDGAKTDGIESILKSIRKYLNVTSVYSKFHGKVIRLEHQGKIAAEMAAWLKPLEPAQNGDGWTTSAGVFSQNAIDKGSLLLADHINGLSGKVADLGAGWGYLAKIALQTNPQITQLDLYEAEDSALNCAKINVIDARAKFNWQDITNMPKDAVYDYIIMNPPFHISRKAEPNLGKQFIQTAFDLLGPNGKMIMVANRQLAYEASLDAIFGTWEQVHETPTYKIISAKRVKPSAKSRANSRVHKG